MMSECERSTNHNLVVSDFVNGNLSSNSSYSESEKWSKDDGASKIEVALDVEDAHIPVDTQRRLNVYTTSIRRCDVV